MEEEKKPVKVKKLIIFDIIIIIIGLIILGASVIVFLDYQSEKQRDSQRVASINDVQDALEEYYAVFGKYPGGVFSGWQVLVLEPKMKSFYDFSNFIDPCQPETAVNENGVVECKARKINYVYQGWNCEAGCQSYKILLYFEAGGMKEFLPKNN